jgi:hypothetical protein
MFISSYLMRTHVQVYIHLFRTDIHFYFFTVGYFAPWDPILLKDCLELISKDKKMVFYWTCLRMWRTDQEMKLRHSAWRMQEEILIFISKGLCHVIF